jgi:hypothetical protein
MPREKMLATRALVSLHPHFTGAVAPQNGAHASHGALLWGIQTWKLTRTVLTPGSFFAAVSMALTNALASW